MEYEDFETIRFDQPATLLWRSRADGVEIKEHFARLRDALRFADGLGDGARRTAWIVLDQGLLAPEDLPLLAQVTAIEHEAAEAAPSLEAAHATAARAAFSSGRRHAMR